MIEGIGIDIVRIDRIKRILEKYPDRFPRRILHPEEYSDYHNKKDRAAFLARQFAAKEAVSKALGLGFTKNLYPKSILIKRDPNGKPYAAVSLPIDRTILVSISDEMDYAIAQAVVIKS